MNHQLNGSKNEEKELFYKTRKGEDPYSLSSFIYYNNIKPTIQFTEKTWTTEAKGGENLPII